MPSPHTRTPLLEAERTGEERIGQMRTVKAATNKPVSGRADVAEFANRILAVNGQQLD